MSYDYADYALGLDIGGTSVVAGVLRRDGSLLGRACMPTDSQGGIHDGLRRLAALIEGVLAQAHVAHGQLAGIGIGASAPVDIVSLLSAIAALGAPGFLLLLLPVMVVLFL